MFDQIDFRWFDFDYTEWWWLLLMIIVALSVFIILLRTGNKKFAVLFSKVPAQGENGYGNIIQGSLLSIRYIALALLVFAMIRPQMHSEQKVIKRYSGGIDIVISLDISGSMLSEDFSPNRLEVAKKVAIDFIKGRKADRIGLVVYEGHAITKCPLTTDYNLLTHQFKQVQSGMISDGTAIGSGLTVAVNRLRESTSKSKVIILLTDGMNNAGNIDPVTAATLAKEYGIKVYAIGVGSRGEALMPHKDPLGRIIRTMYPVDIDENALTQVSEMTGGKYYRATDESSLRKIYNEIDDLEKSDVKITEYKTDPPEKFHSFALLAGILIALEFILRSTVFKSIF